MMIRLFILCFLVSTIVSAQDPIVKLKYAQTVYINGDQTELGQARGFMNVFEPSMIQFAESEANMDIEIQIQNDIILVQTTIHKSEGIFSTKYQIDNKAYALNLMTGEKKQFKNRNWRHNIKKLLGKLKLKKDNSNRQFMFDSEFYKSKIESKELQIHVSSVPLVKSNEGLFEDYFYNGKLILEKKLFDKSKNKEIVLQMISIDTLQATKNLIEIINSNQELDVENKKLKIDSIDFNQEIPDIYYRDVSNGSVVSLNQYKSNGKYLLVDFWGTWCKPCLASIPALKEFYKKHSDKVDLLSMSYKDASIDKIKAKIKETGMSWPQGIATEKVNKLLNPASHFPGIILFDDKMNLIIRDKAKKALKATETIIKDLK